MIVKVVEPSALLLAEASPYIREPRRAERHRQPDFEARFDYRTIFYDVFRSGPDVLMVGPPLWNLKPVLRKATISVDGVGAKKIDYTLLDRTQRSYLRSVESAEGSRLDINVAGQHEDLQIGGDLNDFFDGSRVLFTKSKNNDLAWVRDWLTYHVKIHGADAVLFYDNDSTAYATEDLLTVFEEVDGLKRALIVKWPFQFGPPGGPSKKWDSDFTQYGILDHAKLRFLRRAAAVASLDIDELVVDDDSVSVFERARLSRNGLVTFSGQWIDAAVQPSGSSQAARRHLDYRYSNSLLERGPLKWCLVPDRLPERSQWMVHKVTGVRPEILTATRYRHFKGINTGWKYNRGEVEFDPSIHTVDQALVDVMERAFTLSDW